MESIKSDDGVTSVLGRPISVWPSILLKKKRKKKSFRFVLIVTGKTRERETRIELTHTHTKRTKKVWGVEAVTLPFPVIL